MVVQAELLSNGDDVDAFVEKLISSNDVVIFAKSYCPYCKHTEKLIDEVVQEHGSSTLSVQVVQLNHLLEDDGPLVQMELLTKTGQKTVPNIFIGGGQIAGGDSGLTKLYNSGELQRMLQTVATAKQQKSRL